MPTIKRMSSSKSHQPPAPTASRAAPTIQTRGGCPSSTVLAAGTAGGGLLFTATGFASLASVVTIVDCDEIHGSLALELDEPLRAGEVRGEAIGTGALGGLFAW